MSGLTATELEAMAETVEENFTDTATIHAFISATQTGLGELQNTYNDVIGVTCSISYPSRYQWQNERGEILTRDVDAILKVGKLVDLEEKDEVTVRGKRYKVDGVIDGRSVIVATLKAVEAAE